MAFDFPSSPVLGQEFTSGNITYIWNGYGWVSEPIPDFVNIEGDTMTGALTIRMPGTFGHLILDNPVVTDVTAIALKKNNLWRWSLNATAGPEPGAEVGTNFAIRRYNDAGTLFGDVPFNINRKTGRAQVGQAPVDPNDIATKGYVDATFGGGGPGYLPLTGGTLSGTLTLPNMSVSAAAGGNPDIYGYVGGAVRWLVRMSDNFDIHRYDNAGAYLGNPLSINRSSGQINIAQTLVVGGALGVTGTISGGSVSAPTGTFTNANITNCSSGGTFSLTAVGCNTFTANAITDNGVLTVNGAANLNGSATAPVFTSTSEFQANRGDGQLVLRVTGGSGPVVVDSRGQLNAYWGFMVKPGVEALGRGHAFNIDYNTDGSSALWIDASYMGNFAFTSDYRIKKDVTPLVSMWDKVKALKPISYTHKDYTPPPIGGKDPSSPLIVADDIERWGFIAHELQETLIQTAATGEKDAANVLQSPNPWPLIASLTKALQEAMVRIEMLESKVR